MTTPQQRLEVAVYTMLVENLYATELGDKPQKLLQALVGNEWKTVAIDIMDKYGTSKQIATLKRVLKRN